MRILLVTHSLGCIWATREGADVMRILLVTHPLGCIWATREGAGVLRSTRG